MSIILPPNELERRALAFMLEKLEENPARSHSELLDEAGMRFNLSPLESANIERLLKKPDDPLPSACSGDPGSD